MVEQDFFFCDRGKKDMLRAERPRKLLRTTGDDCLLVQYADDTLKFTPLQHDPSARLVSISSMHTVKRKEPFNIQGIARTFVNCASKAAYLSQNPPRKRRPRVCCEKGRALYMHPWLRDNRCACAASRGGFGQYLRQEQGTR